MEVLTGALWRCPGLRRGIPAGAVCIEPAAGKADTLCLHRGSGVDLRAISRNRARHLERDCGRSRRRPLLRRRAGTLSGQPGLGIGGRIQPDLRDGDLGGGTAKAPAPAGRGECLPGIQASGGTAAGNSRLHATARPGAGVQRGRDCVYGPGRCDSKLERCGGAHFRIHQRGDGGKERGVPATAGPGAGRGRHCRKDSRRRRGQTFRNRPPAQGRPYDSGLAHHLSGPR